MFVDPRSVTVGGRWTLASSSASWSASPSIVRDPASPLDVRLVLIGLLAWIVSPIDLIPEFISVLGPMDDAVVALVALRYVRRRVGVGAMRARWPGTDDGFVLLGRVVGFSPSG